MIHSQENKIIAIDVDDVISSTIPSLLKYFGEIHNINIEYENLTNYRLSLLEEFASRNISENKIHEYWNNFFNSSYGNEIIPIEGSIEGINKIKNLGYDIVLITARWESLQDYTLEWLDKYFPKNSFKEVHFTGVYHGSSIPKSMICKKLGIKLIIEDNVHNCLELAEFNIKSYLFPRPWNLQIKTNNPHILRVDNWGQII
ncbi:MAG: HAD hydrolase-like protein [Candidatus Gracilibacteria bacterium]|nr:HAD hydrolase-like protein [Candidatus Gracilibacteria bacterium]MDD2908794.1 HAD hydrolase-like protein [Candidatus Gracilibacteria bacterium]